MDAAKNSPTTSRSGEYVVVARRYRPQSFGDLIGQEQVSSSLSKAIESHRVGHAYLFTGARGVGKTSTARILAKALNCERGPTPNPCNACDICRGITSGEDVDVLEIDGASARGIDEIRQLRSNVNVRPSRSRFKVYIIDEVHMFTKEAFNALLKTLEEPPEHVKFIFCTTDPEKIPITVLSRCQRFDFPPVQTNSIADRLRTICVAEGVEAEPEALQLLARRAAGSMRDSQSLLEQLLSFCEGRITAHDVHRMLGTARGGSVEQLAKELVERRPDGALRALEAAIGEGVDLGQMAEQLLAYLRDMMAATVGCSAELLLQALPDDHGKLRELGSAVGLETLLAMIQILDQAIVRMRHSPHSRTLFEAALVRIACLERLDDLSRLVAQLQTGLPAGRVDAPSPPARGTPPASAEKKTTERADVADLPPRTAAETARAPRPASSATSSTAMPARESGMIASGGASAAFAGSPLGSAAAGRDERASIADPRATPVSSRFAPAEAEPDELEGASESPAAGADVASPTSCEDSATAGTAAAAVSTPTLAGTVLSPANAVEVWKQVLGQLAAVADITADVASQFAAVRVGGPQRLVIEFHSEYNKNYCERPERMSRLQQAAAAVLGRPIQLEFVLSARAATPEPRQPALSRRQRWRELENHPLVAQAKKMFDAEVVDVQEPRRGERTAGSSEGG